MRILGLEIGLAKAVNAVPFGANGRWTTVFSDLIPGSFQKNVEPPNLETSLAYDAVFACVTQIASDFGSLRNRLMALDDNGIWTETNSAAFSPVLRKPNRFQNHIQFKEWWLTSKLTRGNTYALKERDNRGIVVALYLLDPSRVQVLVADDGSVFYDLQQDNLSGLPGSEGVRVPASEIIHDRMNCLFHPLVGLSPLFACGVSALQGLKIQEGSVQFFGNNSSPGGVLTAPAAISDETAKRLKEHWDANYTGANAGRVAVLGDGLKFEPMRMSAVESQLVEQLNMTAARVCACFHVPASIVGFGTEPVYANGETPQDRYYNRCLRSHIEHYEACMDEGLGLDTLKDGIQYGTQLELKGLLRLDTASQAEVVTKLVAGTLMTPNDGRKEFDLPPLPGGEMLWMQQQNYSLPALAERDRNQPFAKPAPAPEMTEDAPQPDAAAKMMDEIRVEHRQTEDRIAKMLIDFKAQPEEEPADMVRELAALVVAKFASAHAS